MVCVPHSGLFTKPVKCADVLIYPQTCITFKPCHGAGVLWWTAGLFLGEQICGVNQTKNDLKMPQKD